MTEYTRSDLVQLVKRADEKDSEAIQELMRRFRPALFRCARIYVSNDQDAEDLVQETFIKAFSTLDTLDNAAAFPGWIKRICRNAGVDRTRRHPEHRETVFSEMPVPDEDMEYDPADSDALRKAEEAYTNEQRRKILYRILDELPEEQRTVLVMKYYENKGLKEIAQQLSLPMSTVTGRFSVAKSKVKTAVEALQKREGIRLYNIAPVPFLMWLLQSEEQAQNHILPDSYVQTAVAAVQSTPAASPAPASAGLKISQAAARTMADPSAAAAITRTAETATRISPAVILGISLGLAGAGGAGYYAYRTYGNGAGASAPEPTVITETAAPAMTPEEELVFVSDQTFDYTSSENFFMNPDHFNPELHTLITGYPVYGSSIAYSDDFTRSYTPDAVILETEDGVRAVYSYEGTQLSETFTEQVYDSPFMGYLLSDEENGLSRSSYRVFSEDFRQLTWNDLKWAHGETYCCIYQGSPGYFFMYQQPFNPWHFTLSGPTIFPVMSSFEPDRENGVSCSGYVVLDRKNSVISSAPGPVVGPFVNSFYPVVSSSDYDKYNDYSGNHDLPAAFVNGMTGELITDYLYEEFGWFQDGYCPVKRDGKWTYINTLGQEVSGLLFDDASEVYQGRAYVSYNGAMHLINIPETEANHLGAASQTYEVSDGDGAGTGQPAGYGVPDDTENVLADAEADNYVSLVAEHYDMFYYNYLSAIGNDLVPNMEHVTDEFRQVLISRYNRDNYGLIFENEYLHFDMDTYTVTRLSPERIRAEFTVDIMNRYSGRASGKAGVTMRVTMECGAKYNDWQILSSDVLDHSAVSGHNMMDITSKG